MRIRPSKTIPLVRQDRRRRIDFYILLWRCDRRIPGGGFDSGASEMGADVASPGSPEQARGLKFSRPVLG